MKYYEPQAIINLMPRIHSVLMSAPSHRRLRFRLVSGKTIEGDYEGTILTTNDKGFHSLFARIVVADSDYPTAIEFEDIQMVEPAI